MSPALTPPLVLATLAAALAIAAALTSLTVLSVRSERYPSLAVSSFAVSAVALVALLLIVRLPVSVLLWLAATGFALTLLFAATLHFAHRFEARHGLD
jgi:hypothetical protein